ncbi:YTH domain-containing protein ECT3-like [Phragmites australis]|uniref:YTH domain-containing protein ECT3-like n=1 Tax=Phragmites australis TaxID=29695 RepID=UPI002D76E5C8|nr:YTH domain-containing protein ECT3-like [Phragmites australis]
MAAVAPAAGQAADSLQKLSLDPKSEGGKAPESNEKVSGALNGVAASPNPPVVSVEQRATTVPLDYKDAGMYCGGAYPGAYYGGGWGDYSVYVSQDGADALSSGAYGDMYWYPQYGVAASGHDGQIYGSQNYQYPSTYYQPQTTASKPAYKAKTDRSAPLLQDVSTATAADQQPVLVDTSKTTLGSIDGVKGLKKVSLPLKPNGQQGNYQNQGSKAAYPWSGGRTTSEKHMKLSGSSPTSTASNHNNKGFHGQNSPMGSPSSRSMSSIYSSSGMYNTNTYGPSFWYGSHIYGPGLYGGWNALFNGKCKPRGKTYGSYGFGNENLDGLNELKRGPRGGLFKNQKDSGAAVVTPGKGQKLPVSDVSIAVVHDQYNRADFVETYSDAKFFIIKSYSEDDVHKSIKYNVWASTPSGNKKLDAAYLEAKEKSSTSPVFLFFSVNTSGQFVGLAEMVDRVDFSKTVEYWQQDKWTGCFPIKWHIVKDIPNSLLKHIILEYNENKPVTNSRDTQEVKLEQGLQVLKIFKDHVFNTSILDDFGFYDNREKIMQERKSRCHQPLEKITNRRFLTPNSADNEVIDRKQRLQKSEVLGEPNVVVENGAVAVAANSVAPKDPNLATEGLTVANGC